MSLDLTKLIFVNTRFLVQSYYYEKQWQTVNAVTNYSISQIFKSAKNGDDHNSFGFLFIPYLRMKSNSFKINQNSFNQR